MLPAVNRKCPKPFQKMVFDMTLIVGLKAIALLSFKPLMIDNEFQCES